MTIILCTMFQPTHPHGVRRPLFATEGCCNSVSTHAPARGATGRHCPSCYHAGRFNPRTRTGCDQYVAELAIVITCFNPRTRTGCDSTSLLQYVAQRRFQPTHPHGVRRSGVRIQSLRREFQPTHPHGVRLEESRDAITLLRFQPTHPHGVRRIGSCEDIPNT